jgi:hypothetical protein
MKEGKQAGELDRPHQYPNIDDPSPSVDVSVYENSSTMHLNDTNATMSTLR